MMRGTRHSLRWRKKLGATIPNTNGKIRFVVKTSVFNDGTHILKIESDHQSIFIVRSNAYWSLKKLARYIDGFQFYKDLHDGR